ncbi:transposase [Thiotrichales bacterium 19S3-7]|nr:transposase [Thiotrichales bacterium 19S3-7]MCF6801440.1 transposase [Thiotrichales bacterium 19S3-11]
MKKPILTVEQKQLLNQRSIIETLFDHLKNSLMLWHTRHRSVKNAMTHLLSALAE